MHCFLILQAVFQKIHNSNWCLFAPAILACFSGLVFGYIGSMWEKVSYIFFRWTKTWLLSAFILSILQRKTFGRNLEKISQQITKRDKYHKSAL